MKASEFIKRIQTLMEVAKCDPEVIIDVEFGRPDEYEAACIDLSNVTLLRKEKTFNDRTWKIWTRVDNGNDTPALYIY